MPLTLVLRLQLQHLSLDVGGSLWMLQVSMPVVLSSRDKYHSIFMIASIAVLQ